MPRGALRRVKGNMPNRSTAGSAAPSRALAGLLLFASLAAVSAACDETRDETHVEQHPGPGAVGGSGGSLGSAGGGGGSAGTGGSAELGDASVDATPDVDAPLVLEACVLSTIEDYCRHNDYDCPTLEQARFRLRSLDLGPLAIVQRRCSSGAGTPRISVSAVASSISDTKTYVYDAETRRLVSMRITDDTGSCDNPRRLNDDNFGSLGGFYGEKSPDCDFVVPPECGWPVDLRLLDAGIPNETAPADAGDAGVDRRNNECLLAQ
jgi:hypothetical protein